MLNSQRFTVAELLDSLLYGLAGACLVALLLVVARLIARRPWLAVVAVVMIFVFLNVASQEETADVIILGSFAGLSMALVITLLIRSGLLALAVALFLAETGREGVGGFQELTAWHSQPAILTLALVAILVSYGYWAATAGRKLIPEGQ